LHRRGRRAAQRTPRACPGRTAGRAQRARPARRLGPGEHVSGPRLVTRDYKRTRRTGLGLDFGRWREFGIGLGIGLCVAGILYVSDHRATEIPAPDRPTPRRSAPAGGPGGPASASAANTAAPDGSTAAEGQYDFYKLLPKFEVV